MVHAKLQTWLMQSFRDMAHAKFQQSFRDMVHAKLQTWLMPSFKDMTHAKFQRHGSCKVSDMAHAKFQRHGSCKVSETWLKQSFKEMAHTESERKPTLKCLPCAVSQSRRQPINTENLTCMIILNSSSLFKGAVSPNTWDMLTAHA